MVLPWLLAAVGVAGFGAAGYKDLTTYYLGLYNMDAEVAVVPVKKYECYRTYYKILELAFMGYPIVSMNDYPYNHLLTKDENIILAGQKRTFVESVKMLFQNQKERERILKNAQGYVYKSYSFQNKEMMGLYYKLFS